MVPKMQDFIANAVSVTTYSRLHLGFLDLSGQRARQFGSLGLAVDAFKTEITLKYGTENYENSPWIATQLRSQCQALGITEPIHLSIHHAMPRHAGLGSGTQMALAIGVALSTLIGKTPHLADIAHLAGRGKRSGIGIGTFAHGGLVVDGGHGIHTLIPPILFQQPLPADWRVLLILAPAETGIHGHIEKSAFASLAPTSELATQALVARLFMQGLPALCEADFATFAECVGAVQAYNANYFAPAQGGAYAHPLVGHVLTQLKQAGHVGLGQTSWGPTGFVWLPDPKRAEQLQTQLQSTYANQALRFIVSQPINHGAQIRLT